MDKTCYIHVTICGWIHSLKTHSKHKTHLIRTFIVADLSNSSCSWRKPTSGVILGESLLLFHYYLSFAGLWGYELSSMGPVSVSVYPDLSSPYLLGWEEVQLTLSIQSYKWFWAQNVTCCSHCTSKTQRPFDMSQLWTVLICLVTTVCVQTQAERQMWHTQAHTHTLQIQMDINSHQLICVGKFAPHLLSLLYLSVFVSFVLCWALNKCSVI